MQQDFCDRYSGHRHDKSILRICNDSCERKDHISAEQAIITEFTCINLCIVSMEFPYTLMHKALTMLKEAGSKTEECGHVVRAPHIWEVPGSNFGSQTVL